MQSNPTQTAESSARPWFREPMVWMLIVLPVIVIAASIVTIVLAVRSGGGDVYPSEVKRTAQIQVEDLSADRRAIELGLNGSMTIDAATGAVALTLANAPEATQKLRLDLIHPAQASSDLSAELVRSGDGFVGRIDNAAGRTWSVHVSDAEATWRVAGRFDPASNTALLAPALAE
jgi:hypothetical protein